ncbi:hypothetical protein U9M48_016415 [Paspalum notatum var. saurae]|uniref:Sulfotransferase n=1 Tax=Paspalum notatum var. saurae TaxID=547442 RepID=A0AAQ3T5D2_PASNO
MAAQQSKEEGKGSPTDTTASSYDELAAISSESQQDIDNVAALVSKLPTRHGWLLQSFVLYKNYWITPLILQSIMRIQTSFKPRHDDIILASNPKCGTTWMKALAFTITNRSRYELGTSNHPLLSRHPQELIPFVEVRHDTNGDLINYLDTLPSPRLLATHMPLSMFPESISGSRIVYVCREPKDAFVSLWNFANKTTGKEHNIDLESGLDMFIQGFSPYGPFWEHCLEYWRQSISSPDRILFLKYEDMMSEPVKHVIMLAMFLGVPFSAKEEEDGVPEDVVRLCSFEKLSNLHANQSGEAFRTHNMGFDKSAFFRKGVVGDWVNHMSEEMGRKIDCIMEEKLRGSGLVL